MTTDPPPHRKWNITRWLLVLAVLALAWGGWRAYAFRSALAEARALGWEVQYTAPVEAIWADWKSAFKKATWQDGGTAVVIPTSEAFEQHLAIVHRLNPKGLRIDNAATLRELSALRPLTRLQEVVLLNCAVLTNVDVIKNLTALQWLRLDRCTGLTDLDALKNLSALKTLILTGCTGLTNVDALKNLSALQGVVLIGCTGLTNVDALKNLPALQSVYLTGCTGLSKESVASLKAALPNTQIIEP